MCRCVTAVLLLGVSIATAFAQQPDREKSRSRPETRAPERAEAARSANPQPKGSFLKAIENRPQPTATARMVLVRFLIAQVRLPGNEQAAEGKTARGSGPAGEAPAAKPSILAMPEESLFAAERLQKDLEATPLNLRSSNGEIGARLSRALPDRAVEIVDRGQLATLDQQPAYVLLGHREPRVTAIAQTSYGRTMSTTLENVGLQVQCVPFVHDNGRISLELDVEKSQLGSPEEGVVISESNKGETVRSPGYETIVAQTAISVVPGQAVAFSGVRTRRAAQQTEFLILISADLLEGK